MKQTPEAVAADSGLAVAVRDLRFAYRNGAPVLDIPALDVRAGEKVFLFGPSGSGKTTLLGLLAGVLTARQGSVSLVGQNLGVLSAPARDAFRGSHIGYIFQMFNLIPYLNVRDNITLACRMNAARRQRAVGAATGKSGLHALNDAARGIAESLGIAPLLDRGVLELSVGQQQRVAAARALLGAPEIIIADEPTSALDADQRENFLGLLFGLCAKSRSTLVFVSHDRQLQTLFDRSLSLPEINRAGPRGA